MSSPALPDIVPPDIIALPTAPLGLPVAEAIYPNSAGARTALQEHARVNGYGIGVESSTQRRVFFWCAKRGKYDNRHKDPTVHESRQRKNTSTMKTDCKFKAVAQQENGQWKLEVLNNNHNHSPLAALAALLQYRATALTPEERLKVKQMNLENLSPS
jgi:hypothetical protein